MDDLKALSYFSSLCHISRQIALQEKSLIKFLENRWDEYTPEQQEELLDDLCVPQSVREVQTWCADDETDDHDVPSCWPTLKLPSGEKIIVDENDIWTWRDEHSGPFSWKSKSQQDLTLLDLEPENLSKPSTKGRKSESEEHEQLPSSPCYQPFQCKVTSWTEAILTEFGDRTVEPQTPAETPSHTPSPAQSPGEEINPAFEGSCENLSPSSSPAHVPSADADVHVDTDSRKEVRDSSEADVELEADVHTTKGKSGRGRKSPSPKKILRSGSFKKEGKGKSSQDTGHQLLISDTREEGSNAFCNPALESETEWSNFIGQTSSDAAVPIPKNYMHVSAPGAQLTTSTQDQTPPVIEPVAMEMDRGIGRDAAESVENTPDHSTHLLKPKEAVIEAAEKEEVLYVVDDGKGFSLQSEIAGSSSSLNIPKTGFDFLDDW